MENLTFTKSHLLLLLSIVVIYGFIAVKIKGRVASQNSKISTSGYDLGSTIVLPLEFDLMIDSYTDPFTINVAKTFSESLPSKAVVKQVETPSTDFAPDSILTQLQEGKFYGLLTNTNKQTGIFKFQGKLETMECNRSVFGAVLIQLNADSATFMHKRKTVSLKRVPKY